MKKPLIGLAAVGAVIALRPVLKRRVVQKMHGHCQQMAAKCKQMMAAPSTESGEAAQISEHCKQMAGQFRGDKQATATSAPSEQEAPQFVSGGRHSLSARR